MQHLGYRSRKSHETMLVSRKGAVVVDDDNPYDKNGLGGTRNNKASDYRILFLRVHKNWTQLPKRSRWLLYALFAILLQNVLVVAWDYTFRQVGEQSSATSSLGSRHESTSFAVAINTYRRPDRLRDAVQHYADVCGKSAGVSQVFVIWAEQGVQVPEPTSFFSSLLRYNNPKNRAQVQVLQKSKDSLNSRFEPIDELTSTAVFMVDDDIRVDCASLAQGFDAWKKHPDAMVGYYPRLASPPLRDPESPELIYHTWPIVFWRHKFNFVLTKACFLHSKYLTLYSGEQFPQEVRDHVDKHMNCEDIAMSMLVANYTKAISGTPEFPVYVEGSVNDRGLFGGISTGSGHMTTRSDCLTTLTRIFKAKGWESPLSYEIPLNSYSWIRHSPDYWWKYAPSNFFEWLSFANILT